MLTTFLSRVKWSFRDHLRGLFDYNTSVLASTEWWPFIDNQQLNPSMGGFIAECKGSVVSRQSNSLFLQVVFGPWISFSRLVQTNPNLLHQSTQRSFDSGLNKGVLFSDHWWFKCPVKCNFADKNFSFAENDKWRDVSTSLTFLPWNDWNANMVN